MRAHVFLSVLCASALSLAGASGRAAVVTQSDTASFVPGIATGAASAMSDPSSPDGGFGIVPSPGTVIFSDDFNYDTRSAAEGAGWLFLTPNTAEIATQLDNNPDEFLFSSDTSTTGGTAPAAGAFRMRVSRPHDLTNTEDRDNDAEGNPVPNTTRQPVLAMWSTPVTGDFVAETKLKIQYERFPSVTRHQGIFVTHPSSILSGKAEGVTIDGSSAYVAWGPSKNDFLNMLARLYDSGSRLINYQTQSFPGTEYTVRLVKRGIWYYGYIRTGDTGPWVLQSWFAAPNLAATSAEPVIVGLFGKSWGSVGESSPRYGDTDYDYFRLNRIGDTSGTFTSVMGAGSVGNWQTFSYSAHSMPGTKYQLRAGNVKSGGTLTDAGPFTGPGGANTWYQDDAAQVIPNAMGKRYLEYKFDLDGSADNLPAYVDLVRASFEPTGTESSFLSTKADFGADAGGLQVQPGDGDLSLARTQVYLDDFNTDEAAGIGGDNADGSLGNNISSNGWDFYSGTARFDPSVVTRYSMTERPGFFRLTVGYPQDLKEGGEDLGGVTLLRFLPSGVTDYEIETEVEVPVQMSRQAGLIAWLDPDNFVGITVARRNETTFEVGALEQTVLSNAAVPLATLNYGSGKMQLRLTKHGNIYTYSIRDAASPSPSWRVVGVRNSALRSEFFTPIQVGLIGKSYGLANREPVDYDFDYFKISTLTETGTKDLAFNIPGGARPDIVNLLGDALSAPNTRAQISTGGGFVGPDGTSSSFFTVNEPKLPASISSPATVRLTMDNTTDSGSPYLHAIGVQYLTGDTAVARDTNAADFNAAQLKDNVNTADIPGVAQNGGHFSYGDWAKDDFNFTSEDLTGSGWTWDTTYVNQSLSEDEKSRYSVTTKPGYVRLIIGPREDIGTGAHYHVFFRKTDSMSGDWQIETLIDTTENGRDSSRITGLGVWQTQNNLILFGLLNDGSLTQRSYNNSGSIVRDASAPGAAVAYYLRIQKVGQEFTSWALPTTDEFGQPTDPNSDPNAPDTKWTLVAKRQYNGITTPQVGLMGMSVNPVNPQWPVDYDYFRSRPLDAAGILVSRVLDLGAGGYTPVFSAAGSSLGAATFQFRAADTQAALSSLPWLGPDGTSATTYPAGNTGAALNGLNKRYIQYRVTLPKDAALNDVTFIAAAGAVPAADALTALKIAGGLQAATSADTARFDVVGGASAGKIDLADAVQLLRSASGL